MKIFSWWYRWFQGNIWLAIIKMDYNFFLSFEERIPKLLNKYLWIYQSVRLNLKI